VTTTKLNVNLNDNTLFLFSEIPAYGPLQSGKATLPQPKWPKAAVTARHTGAHTSVVIAPWPRAQRRGGSPAEGAAVVRNGFGLHLLHTDGEGKVLGSMGAAGLTERL
jgi:hypothetical protein